MVNDKKDCIFCKIATKEILANVVAETEDFIAFLDVNPVSKGHTLVIPKKHFVNFSDFIEKSTDAYIAKFMRFIETVRKIIKDKYGVKSCYIRINHGKLLEVSHLHVHIVPVYN